MISDNLDLDSPSFGTDLAHEIERTESYLSDLRRLAAGQYPSAAELTSATVISGAWRGLRQAGCILGVWPGDDRVLQSSRLLVLAVSQGWARTTNALYRLENWAGGDHES